MKFFWTKLWAVGLVLLVVACVAYVLFIDAGATRQQAQTISVGGFALIWLPFAAWMYVKDGEATRG